MPQLDFSLYLSQILTYTFCFSTLSFVVFLVVYPRIEYAINGRLNKIEEMSTQIRSLLDEVELIRKKLSEQEGANNRIIEDLKADLRVKALSKFNSIIKESEVLFDQKMREGEELIISDINNYKKKLINISNNIADNLVSDMGYKDLQGMKVTFDSINAPSVNLH